MVRIFCCFLKIISTFVWTLEQKSTIFAIPYEKSRGLIDKFGWKKLKG